MDIFHVVGKLLARHVVPHLLVPLIVAASLECAYACYIHEGIIKRLLARDRVIALAALVLTYSVIAIYRTSRKTSVHFRKLQLAILQDELKTAVEYFAVSTFRLREWFHPYAQAYLANVISRRYDCAKFRYMRVFFFFTEDEWKNAQCHYLDGNYLKALSEIHQRHDIDMGFLKRSDILELIKGLSMAERRRLALYPRVIRGLPDNLLRRYPLKLRRRFPEFDFALIEHEDGEKTVLPFKKEGEIFRIEKRHDPATVELYERVVNKIRDVIQSETGSIKLDHDLTRVDVE